MTETDRHEINGMAVWCFCKSNDNNEVVHIHGTPYSTTKRSHGSNNEVGTKVGMVRTLYEGKPRALFDAGRWGHEKESTGVLIRKRKGGPLVFFFSLFFFP